MNCKVELTAEARGCVIDSVILQLNLRLGGREGVNKHANKNYCGKEMISIIRKQVRAENYW